MYIGPEVLMPVASAVAAALGVVLMFWRRLKQAFRAGVSTVGKLFSRQSSSG